MVRTSICKPWPQNYYITISCFYPWKYILVGNTWPFFLYFPPIRVLCGVILSMHGSLLCTSFFLWCLTSPGIWGQPFKQIATNSLNCFIYRKVCSKEKCALKVLLAKPASYQWSAHMASHHRQHLKGKWKKIRSGLTISPTLHRQFCTEYIPA